MCSSICFCDCKSPVICAVVCRQSQCHGTSRYDHGLSCKLIIDKLLIQFSIFFINIEKVIIVCFKLRFRIKGQDDFFCAFHRYSPVCRGLCIVRMIWLQICRINAVDTVIIIFADIATHRTGCIIICGIVLGRIILAIRLDLHFIICTHITMIRICRYSIYCTARFPCYICISCSECICPCNICFFIINTYFRSPGKCRNYCRRISGIIKICLSLWTILKRICTDCLQSVCTDSHIRKICSIRKSSASDFCDTSLNRYSKNLCHIPRIVVLTIILLNCAWTAKLQISGVWKRPVYTCGKRTTGCDRLSRLHCHFIFWKNILCFFYKFYFPIFILWRYICRIFFRNLYLICIPVCECNVSIILCLWYFIHTDICIVICRCIFFGSFTLNSHFIFTVKCICICHVITCHISVCINNSTV